MQVSFKLYPNQMLDLGFALALSGMTRARQSGITFEENILKEGRMTGLTIDGKNSTLMFEGSRKEFQVVLPMFALMPTPMHKLYISHYDNDGMSWLKFWETQDDYIQTKATGHNATTALRFSFNAKDSSKHVDVDTVKLAERLNVTKLVKLVKADDWTKIQASYGKDEVELAKAIALYDKNKAAQSAPAQVAVAA